MSLRAQNVFGTFEKRAPIVQRLHRANHWINPCPVDKSIVFDSTYSVASDLSPRWRYLTFKQLAADPSCSKDG